MAAGVGARFVTWMTFGLGGTDVDGRGLDTRDRCRRGCIGAGGGGQGLLGVDGSIGRGQAGGSETDAEHHGGRDAADDDREPVDHDVLR